MTRLELDSKLREILGNNNTYYNPPESLSMHYPCFRYELDDITQVRADNRHYIDIERYSVTYITKKSESDIVKHFFTVFPTSSFDRKYSADNMWHYVFTVYS